MKELKTYICLLGLAFINIVTAATEKPNNGLCPINPTLPTDAAGNTYECPKFNDDGTENTHTECCHNDRPDAEGNYHSCCQNEADKTAEQNAAFYRILAYIATGTAVCIAFVIVYTYCKPDTFPCLKPLKRYSKRAFDFTMDAICFCPCLPKQCQRGEPKKEKKKRERGEKNKPNVPQWGDDNLVKPDSWYNNV
ncbi:uncharacterized protein [Antedon mediterranea]|uniref:uncharacterized protein n=1 Tax=Antedon mediterranea TaxID=105859 RepID=UPI003AF6C539